MNMAMLTPTAAKQQAVILRIEAQKIMRSSGGAASPDQISRYRDLSRRAEALETAARQGREVVDACTEEGEEAKPRRISVEEAVRLKDAGATYAELAELLGCSDEQAAGVKVRVARARAQTGAAEPEKARIRRIDMDQMRRLVASGVSNTQMAALLKVGPRSINRALARLRAE